MHTAQAFGAPFFPYHVTAAVELERYLGPQALRALGSRFSACVPLPLGRVGFSVAVLRHIRSHATRRDRRYGEGAGSYCSVPLPTFSCSERLVVSLSLSLSYSYREKTTLSSSFGYIKYKCSNPSTRYDLYISCCNRSKYISSRQLHRI